MRKWTDTTKAGHVKSQLLTMLEESGELHDLALACTATRRLLCFDEKVDSNSQLAISQKGSEEFLSEPRPFARCSRLWPVLFSSFHQALKDSQIDDRLTKSFLKFLIPTTPSDGATNQRLEMYWLLRFTSNSHTKAGISIMQIATSDVNSCLSIYISHVCGHIEKTRRRQCLNELTETQRACDAQLSLF